jgi:hypothetical protein
MAMPRSSRKSCLAALALAAVFVPILGAQTGPGVQQQPLNSDLLDQLLGVWAVAGTILGQPVREGADAEWVLGHQFLRIHRKQLDGPGESVMHVGFDTVLQRFVAIRLDSLSARGAETIGYGLQTGDKLQFTFDYPTAPMRETWSWDGKEKTWQFVVEIERRNPKGAAYVTFSTLNLRHFQGGRGGPRGFAPLPPHPPPAPSPQ